MRLDGEHVGIVLAQCTQRVGQVPAVPEKVCALFEQSAKAEQLLARKDATLAKKNCKIAALTLEFAPSRRIRFGNRSEA